MTTYKAYPATPVPGLSLRSLRGQGTHKHHVSFLRVRAQLLEQTAGVDPLYSFDIPGLEGRAIVSAYAHPFVADFVDPDSPDPTASDSRVVRPVIAIRGPRSLEMALIDNATGGWPGAMSGSLDQAPFGEAHHYQEEEAWRDNGAPQQLFPTRITNVYERGPSASNPSGMTEYTLTLASGASIRVDAPNSDPPLIGEPYPADQEQNRFQTVGSYGKASQETYPRRNAYAVPIKEDEEDVASGPYQQESNPDTVTAVRVVVDYPNNPSTEIQKVTLASGATVRVPIGTNVVVGLPLSDPSAVLDSPDPIDPNEWWEFDVILVHAPQAAGSGELIGAGSENITNPDGQVFQSPGGAAIDVTEPAHLAGMERDVWPILPNLISGTA